MQDKEKWKSLQGFRGLYKISNYGNVKSLAKLKHTPYGGTFISKEKILKPSLINSGYLIVTLSKEGKGRCYLLHILTASHFVKNPQPSIKKFINHNDGVKVNNHYTNLMWCTRSENMIHAFRTGLCKKKAL